MPQFRSLEAFAAWRAQNFTYKGKLYPDYIRRGNAAQFILPIAQQFCKGEGLDIGSGQWPFPGARPHDIANGDDAMALPDGVFDFIFSSHALEHLINPVAALQHWQTRLKSGGCLFLYLPHPDQEYWLPQNCTKHLHTWAPEQMHKLIEDLGFLRVMSSGRDLAWSFAVVGFAP